MPVPSRSVAQPAVPAARPFTGPALVSLERWGVNDADLHAWARACLKSTARNPGTTLAATLSEADTLFPGLAVGLPGRWVGYATTFKVFHPAGRVGPACGGGFRFLGGLTPLYLAAGIDPSTARSWIGPATGNDLAATTANENFIIERIAQMARARGWSVAQQFGAWSVHSLRVRP